jgi:hypothetical protein
MAKLFILIVGAALGFGGGIYYSARHPDNAASLTASAQHDALEAQLKFAQTATTELNKAIDSGHSVINKDTLTNLRDEQQKKADTIQAELNAPDGQ